MDAIEDTINQYLKTLGVTINQPFNDVQGSNPVIRLTQINYMNIKMGIVVYGQIISPIILLGWLPKQNIAPLYRRLLNLNGVMGGSFFYIDVTGGITLALMRSPEGLDVSEFKWMLDQLGGMYWQHAATLVQEFQILLQPV